MPAIDRSLADAVCFVFTCRRLIDLSACRYFGQKTADTELDSSGHEIDAATLSAVVSEAPDKTINNPPAAEAWRERGASAFEPGMCIVVLGLEPVDHNELNGQKGVIESCDVARMREHCVVQIGNKCYALPRANCQRDRRPEHERSTKGGGGSAADDNDAAAMSPEAEASLEAVRNVGFVLTCFDFVLKMFDFVLKMLDFAADSADGMCLMPAALYIHAGD